MNHNDSTKKKNNQPVKVYIRQRPFNQYELSVNCPDIIQHMTNHELIIKSGASEKRYSFDEVFGEEASQKEIYNVVASPLINCIISGYNCTIFAYGQTGTGKTHTMVGQKVESLEESSVGLIPRSVTHLFEELERIDSKIEYTVRISFIEIYNEEVRDLLSPSGSIVRIFDDPENKGSVCMKGLKEVTVLNVQEVYEWLNLGITQRQTAATNMNRQSSRSHSIFTLSVLTRQLTVDGDELIKIGKLYLVDLAGSENLGRSGSTELRAREAANINKSLLTLGKVIKSLAQKSSHVPYRDSKLTRILQDSLGGKTKTCMIATISAAANAWDETISTLDYAQEARNVSNCPQVNENRKQTNLLNNLKDEIGRLRKELAVARAGEGFYMSRENYDKLCQNLEQLQQEVIDKRKRLSDLIRKNDELELEICSKEEQVRNRDFSYNSIKQELEERQALSKRDEYVIDYLEKREQELKSAAEQLWKICEISTKHETLFYQKYENQCHVSLENGNIAKKAITLFGDSINVFNNVATDYTSRQHSYFNEVHSNVSCLKENAWKMCRRLSEYSKKIAHDSIEESLTINKDSLYSDLEKLMDDLAILSSYESQKKMVQELENFTDLKMKEMEVVTSRCVNAIKQLTNDYVVCTNDIMKSQLSLIASLKKSIQIDEVSLNKNIEHCRERTNKFFTKLIKEIEEKFSKQKMYTEELRSRYSCEINNIKSDFTADSESKVNKIMVDLRTAESNQNSYENSVKQFAHETLEQIKLELDKNVQFRTHVGDTPARQNYIFPRIMENTLRKSGLYKEFEKRFD